MLETICDACKHGEHNMHHEAIQTPPPGMLGGSRCRCKGECIDGRYISTQFKNTKAAIEAYYKQLGETSMIYDSRPDTLEHIGQVQGNMFQIIRDLSERSTTHDQSKLVEPEVSVFNQFTPKLKESTYGSDEYYEFIAEMQVGLDHHYAHNDHHPEHFDGGIAEMNLMQLTEMLADWAAATKRHDNGDLLVSILHNAERFGYGGEIIRLLVNTAKDLGWIHGS